MIEFVCVRFVKFHYASWFGAGSKLVRSWAPTSFEPDSVMEFGLTVRADDDDRRTSTSPTTSGDREPASREETGSSLTVSRRQQASDAAVSLTPARQDGGALSAGSSPSAADDEPMTSRLSLLQVSALTDSYEADPTASVSVEEDSITAGDESSVGEQPDRFDLA